jgi:hypothetical protein
VAIDWAAKVEALEEMKASGQKRAKIGDMELEFRSMKELDQALAYASAKANGRRSPKVGSVRFEGF